MVFPIFKVRTDLPVQRRCVTLTPTSLTQAAQIKLFFNVHAVILKGSEHCTPLIHAI